MTGARAMQGNELFTVCTQLQHMCFQNDTNYITA